MNNFSLDLNEDYRFQDFVCLTNIGKTIQINGLDILLIHVDLDSPQVVIKIGADFYCAYGYVYYFGESCEWEFDRWFKVEPRQKMITVYEKVTDPVYYT